MILPVYQNFPSNLAPQGDLYYPFGQKMKNISQVNSILFHFKIKNKEIKKVYKKISLYSFLTSTFILVFF